jgi:hypothetical protein
MEGLSKGKLQLLLTIQNYKQEYDSTFALVVQSLKQSIEEMRLVVIISDINDPSSKVRFLLLFAYEPLQSF